MSNLHEQDNLQGTPLLFHQNLSTANEFDDSGVIDIPNSSVDRAKGIFLQLQSRESPHFYIAAEFPVMIIHFRIAFSEIKIFRK